MTDDSVLVVEEPCYPHFYGDDMVTIEIKVNYRNCKKIVRISVEDEDGREITSKHVVVRRSTRFYGF